MADLSKKYTFYFPKCECEKPIIYHLVKDYDLVVNVYRAKVTANEEGYLVLDISGEEDHIEKALDFVRSFNVTISTTEKGMVWNDEKCVHCGACLTCCPTAALHTPDPLTREIAFDPEKCIECLACIRVCPFDACTSAF